MRLRQVHLDFHTSELIEDIGSRFDAGAFGAAFRDAHVDSVTVFSKCHHGHSYHPTTVGRMHPHLKFDLLRAQIDALHANGIKAPVYLSAGWDEYAANTEPGWRLMDERGLPKRVGGDPLGDGWAYLDFASPYLAYLCRQVEEVMVRYPDGDGIFIDIPYQQPSAGPWAQQRMQAQGMDWQSPSDRRRFAEQVSFELFDGIQAAVRKHDPARPLFFNLGHVRRVRRDVYKRYFSHLELESLPTAKWGYDHFPLSARYVDAFREPFIGMTGKFHHLWGEIGSYKSPAALVYEVAAMQAHGAGASIGDHLHPNCEMDATTYRSVALAYAAAEASEPWAIGSVNRADIGVVSAEGSRRPAFVGTPDTSDFADEGAARVLLEGKFTFDVLDPEADFSAYRLLILPDEVVVDDSLRASLDAYLAGGGKLLLTGRSGIDEETGFLFDVGANWRGTNAFPSGDYALHDRSIRADFVDDPIFMYVPSEQIEVTAGESLGTVFDPYFERSPKHFSGHVHTPRRSLPSGYAAGVRKHGITYLAHPVFTAYRRSGAVAVLEMLEKVIAQLLDGNPLVRTSLPRAGRITVRRQAEHSRDVVHLMLAHPVLRGELRGDNVQPIQDFVEVCDVEVDLSIDSPPAGIRLVPDGAPLPFEVVDGRVRFQVPRLLGHVALEVNYGGQA
ncbi:MAG: beta-galactosidase trimerization domain-containing protein [Devosia nanyangense]|uniref:Beta-galactosidase trimerization domain-containing protein n=1 Tax=Devosia nanyangense TaxID=1228055 RepID=A0A933L116_9HYPH|nr:beta-galactosidase trimerization domain-containing protein [Devosia nanyangense]